MKSHNLDIARENMKKSETSGINSTHYYQLATGDNEKHIVSVRYERDSKKPHVVAYVGLVRLYQYWSKALSFLATMPLSESTEPCYCYPPVIGCVHCERAARYVQVEVLTLANELGETGHRAFYDGTEGVELENEYSTPEKDTYDVVHQSACDVSLHEGDPDNFDWEDRTPNPDGPPCDLDCGDDPEPEIQDVMQWFIVSTWLANRLREIDEPVLDYMGLELWGRTCCGQGIVLDGTFQNISRRLGV